MKEFSSFLLIIMISLTLLFTAQINAVDNKIVLKHLTGEVQYKTSGWLFFSSNWKKLNESTTLSKGDLIKTGSNGKAQITFANQARTLIKGSSKLKIVKSNKELSITKVRLSLGEVIVKFIDNINSKQQFEVETPSAVAGVRGTLFKVVVNKEKETKVSVNEGQVEVSSKGGKVVIEKGEGAVINDKKKKPEVIPAEKINAKESKKTEEKWIKETKKWEKEAKQRAKEAKKEAKEKKSEKSNQTENEDISKQEKGQSNKKNNNSINKNKAEDNSNNSQVNNNKEKDNESNNNKGNDNKPNNNKVNENKEDNSSDSEANSAKDSSNPKNENPKQSNKGGNH